MPYQDTVPLGEHFCIQVALLIADWAPEDVMAENQCGSEAHAVIPLWQITYEEQLQIKLKWSCVNLYKQCLIHGHKGCFVCLTSVGMTLIGSKSALFM
jgi:hypothetical protein